MTQPAKCQLCGKQDGDLEIFDIDDIAPEYSACDGCAVKIRANSTSADWFQFLARPIDDASLKRMAFEGLRELFIEWCEQHAADLHKYEFAFDDHFMPAAMLDVWIDPTITPPSTKPDDLSAIAAASVFYEGPITIAWYKFETLGLFQKETLEDDLNAFIKVNKLEGVPYRYFTPGNKTARDWYAGLNEMPPVGTKWYSYQECIDCVAATPPTVHTPNESLIRDMLAAARQREADARSDHLRAGWHVSACRTALLPFEDDSESDDDDTVSLKRKAEQSDDEPLAKKSK